MKERRECGPRACAARLPAPLSIPEARTCLVPLSLSYEAQREKLFHRNRQLEHPPYRKRILCVIRRSPGALCQHPLGEKLQAEKAGGQNSCVIFDNTKFGRDARHTKKVALLMAAGGNILQILQ
jgi:hypothetical protein